MWRSLRFKIFDLTCKYGIRKSNQRLFAAVIYLQILRFDLRKISHQLAEKLLFAAAETINTLLYVADVKKAAKPILSVSGDDLFDERTHDLVLRDVRVLKFVDEQVIYAPVESKIKHLRVRLAAPQKLVNQARHVAKGERI